MFVAAQPDKANTLSLFCLKGNMPEHRLLFTIPERSAFHIAFGDIHYLKH